MSNCNIIVSACLYRQKSIKANMVEQIVKSHVIFMVYLKKVKYHIFILSALAFILIKS